MNDCRLYVNSLDAFCQLFMSNVLKRGMLKIVCYLAALPLVRRLKQ